MPGAAGADVAMGHPAGGVACYLLNLDRSPGRLSHARMALESVGLSPVRVPGVDGATLSDGERSLADPRASRRVTGRMLSDGELGCYLGHLRALRRMLADGVPYALVCEDDVRPGPALGAVCAALSERGGDWKVAILANPARRLFTPIDLLDIAGRHFTVQRAHYPPMNAWANLWTRAGAEEMVREFDRPLEPWDHAVRRFAQRSDAAIALDPSPIAQPEDQSEIDARGSRSDRDLLYRWRKWRRLSQQKRRARALMRTSPVPANGATSPARQNLPNSRR